MADSDGLVLVVIVLQGSDGDGLGSVPGGGREGEVAGAEGHITGITGWGDAHCCCGLAFQHHGVAVTVPLVEGEAGGAHAHSSRVIVTHCDGHRIGTAHIPVAANGVADAHPLVPGGNVVVFHTAHRYRFGSVPVRSGEGEAGWGDRGHCRIATAGSDGHRAAGLGIQHHGVAPTLSLKDGQTLLPYTHPRCVVIVDRDGHIRNRDGAVAATTDAVADGDTLILGGNVVLHTAHPHCLDSVPVGCGEGERPGDRGNGRISARWRHRHVA